MTGVSGCTRHHIFGASATKQHKKGEDQMWIMTNNSYLSIVSKDCGPADLLVRARRAGDIEKVFPNAKVTRQTDSDYLYRAILPRDVVKQALAAMIDLIDYPNFKDSVEDRSLHAAYVRIRAFAQDALRDRSIRPLRQPEFQNGIDDLSASRNRRIHGEASIDDRVNAKRGIGKTRGEIREE